MKNENAKTDNLHPLSPKPKTQDIYTYKQADQHPLHCWQHEGIYTIDAVQSDINIIRQPHKYKHGLRSIIAGY